MAGKYLRAFRWGTVAYHPNATYLDPSFPYANNAGESGRTIESYVPCPHRNFRRKFPALENLPGMIAVEYPMMKKACHLSPPPLHPALPL